VAEVLGESMPEISGPNLNGRVKMLWHSGYWDGPLSGYVSLDDVPGYWVDCIDEDYNPHQESIEPECIRECTKYKGGRKCCLILYDRLYLVYKLDEQQKEIILNNHDLFQKYVGTHADYDSQGQRHHNVNPEADWKSYYDVDKPPMPPPREEQIVGHTTELFPQRKKL
jgi:hypothetical protein